MINREGGVVAIMATFQSGFDPSLEDLPAWKRDLILRKRANSRIHGGLPMRGGEKLPCGIPQQQMLIYSVPGNTQLSSRSLWGPAQDSSRLVKGRSYNYSNQSASRSGPVSSGCDDVGEVTSDAALGPLKSAIIDSAMRGPGITMREKGLIIDRQCHVGPEVARKDASDEDEDLSYGPGIVSRLKNRYMSIAMREARNRPSIRKYSSLEDLLDEGPAWHERGRSSQKFRPQHGGGSPARREMMKRARSVDSIALRRSDSNDHVPKSLSSCALRQANLDALGKEDIIIIETIRPAEQNGNTPPQQEENNEQWRPALLDDKVLPTADIVRNVKQIFESSSGRQVRGTAAKVAAYKATHVKKPATVPSAKPAIKAKPPQLKAKKPSSPIEEVRLSLKQVPAVGKLAPRSTLRVKAIPGETGPAVTSPPVSLGLTPVAASVTAPCVNGFFEEGIKDVSSSAASNIGNQSLFQEFNFTDPATPPSQEPQPRPHSPVTTLPPSPPLMQKVGSSQALKEELDNTKENQRVLQENKKNAEKSNYQKEALHNQPPPVAQPKLPPSSPKTLQPKSEKPKPRPRMSSPPPPPSSVRCRISSNSAGSRPKLSPPSTPSSAVKQPYPSSPVRSPEIESKPFIPQRTLQLQQEYLNQTVPTDNGDQVYESKAVVNPINTKINKKPEDSRKEKLETSASLLEVIKAAEANSSKSSLTSSPAVGHGLKAANGRESRRKQQETTSLVFNFSKRTDTPDYIENDGVDMSKRRNMGHEAGYVIMPGYEGRNDSSTDGDDAEEDLPSTKQGEIPPPCDIVFEGEAIIINGRSNLQRQPRNKKLEISFDMASTSIFEYQSENSLLEEYMASDPPDSEKSPPSFSSGGLANYTPSKLQLSDSFELGISRSALPPTPPKEKPPSLEEDLLQEHLLPAGETETIAWSAEVAPDMLF